MNINVRYFIFEDELCDIIECNEQDFLDCEYPIHYERHSVFQNGVSQICLTKMPEG